MKKSKTIKFREKEITVNELTVHQVQTLLEKIEARSSEGIDHNFVLSVQDAAPSELAALYNAAEEINPFLLKMYQKMTAKVGVVPAAEMETAV